jgi:hypothetical protein
MTKQYLFVCGSPRSGTTAMWNFLTSDERIKMGVERFGNLFFSKPLSAELFEKNRFYDLVEGDTFYSSLDGFTDYYTSIEANYENGIYYGDKIPLLYNYLDRLSVTLPQAKVVIMLRNIIDVAASYEARANNESDDSWNRDKRTKSAIEDWRTSLKVIKENIDNSNIIPVIYEDFYSDISEAQALYDELGLNFTPEVKAAYESTHKRALELEGFRARQLNSAGIKSICEEAPFGLYREVLEKIRNRRD